MPRIIENKLIEELVDLTLYKQEFAKKWERSLLLEGETDPFQRLDLALLLENQYKNKNVKNRHLAVFNFKIFYIHYYVC